MGGKKDIKYDNRVPGPGYYDNTEDRGRDASPAWK